MREVKKKVLGIAVALMAVAMLVTPVLAIGPMKVPEGKNKNSVVPYPNAVWLFTDHGSFQEWFDDGEDVRYRLMRKNASICNIGGAVDASGWTFPPAMPGYNFWQLLTAESRWVYVDQTGMYNLLVGFGFDPGMAFVVSGMHPDGAYYKADMVGNYPY